MFHHIFNVILCIFLILCITHAESDHTTNHILRYQLKRRHTTLKQIALTALNDPFVTYRPPHCPKDRLIITEYAFGRSGNNLIEFTHGLWLSRRLNATLVVPTWIQGIFQPFDTSLLQSIYCYTLDTSNNNIPKDRNKAIKVYEITSENSFFLFQLKKEFLYPQFIPEIIQFHYEEVEEQKQQSLPSSSSSDPSSSVMMESISFSPSSLSSSSSSSFLHSLSKHFLQVYAALWSSPQKKLLFVTEFILEYYMKGSLGYSAVHKRQLEGGCAKVLSSVTSITDYSSKEIPLYHSEWFNHPLHKYHPICEMSVSFIEEILFINHRQTNLSNVYVAYDGHGDTSSYEQKGVVFIHYLLHFLTNKNNHNNQQISSPHHLLDISSHMQHKLLTMIDVTYLKEMMKYIDMLVAIHSEFFILNPRSTFSFQIYVIRVCLGLQSVPVMRNNDFYMQKIPDDLKKSDRSLWVSWMSILQAATELV